MREGANDTSASDTLETGAWDRMTGWLAYLADCHAGNRQNERRVARLTRKTTKPVPGSEGDVGGHEEAMRDRSDRHSGKAGRQSRAPLAWEGARGEVWA